MILASPAMNMNGKLHQSQKAEDTTKNAPIVETSAFFLEIIINNSIVTRNAKIIGKYQ